jgi:hypothetical protein
LKRERDLLQGWTLEFRMPSLVWRGMAEHFLTFWELHTMTPQTFAFAHSFWPIAIGFFGPGTGYFIWGGQSLSGYPRFTVTAHEGQFR